MTFEIFKGRTMMGEVEADSATAALQLGRELFGNGCNSAIAKEALDITVLHSSNSLSIQKSICPPLASSERPSPEVADLKNGCVYGVAANGEGHQEGRAMVSRPAALERFYPIKDKTHPTKKQKAKRKFHEDRGKKCADKTRYANPAAAHDAIGGLIRKKGRKTFSSMRAYKCECGGWHITRN